MTGKPGYDEVAVIYRLGYPNMGNNDYSDTNPPSNADDGGHDPKVSSTLLRHGNYDYENAETLWDPSIADQVLPPSLYLDETPSWWGSSPWPVIGSDLSPMVSTIPAEQCYASMQGGVFDPQACYGNGPPQP
jgi:hypothetical protein